MRALTLLALFLASTAAALAQQQPATELTPEAAFTAKVKAEAAGSLAAEEIIYLHLARRSDAQTAKSDFVNAVNSTRTDIQVGASSNAPGATTLVEKPGAADLLQLAIESGAVSETKNGTSLTLATTPYMLAGFFGVRDTPDAWRDYAALRHFALSATFSNDADVEKGDLTSIQSGEVKWTILGNRSPRDAAVAIALQPALMKFAKQQVSVNTVCTDPTGLANFDQFAGDLHDWIVKQTAAGAAPSDAAVRAEIDKLFSGVAIDPQHQKAIATCADAILVKEAAANQFVTNMAALSAAYVALNKAHQLSIAASTHRDATIDDFSTLKILYGRNTVPKLSLNLNGEANFNQHHNAKNLHQLRSFAVEGGLTMGRFNEGRFDATVSGKLWRNADSQDRNVGVVQVKGNVYLANSLVLPVSLSYASKPVDTIRKGFQINLGIASLLDSFLTKSLAATP